MSEFTGEGFKPFPNTYEDAKRLGSLSELTTDVLERKINEYGEFLQREDIMNRARTLGSRILDHALFELAYRDGMHEEYTNKQEDELCELVA